MQDCHVIKYLSKEEHDGRSAALVVGGKNVSPFYVRIIISKNKFKKTNAYKNRDRDFFTKRDRIIEYIIAFRLIFNSK